METGGTTALITSLKTALAEFNVTNIGEIIVAGLTIAVPLVLGWFAFRWIYKRAKGALKRGS